LLIVVVHETWIESTKLSQVLDDLGVHVPCIEHSLESVQGCPRWEECKLGQTFRSLAAKEIWMLLSEASVFSMRDFADVQETLLVPMEVGTTLMIR
jgi:hypothetical protein